jgi:hypothetical protein
MYGYKAYPLPIMTYPYNPPLTEIRALPPNTMQKPLPRAFLDGTDNSSYTDKYALVRHVNLDLADPITYESLGRYIARQTEYRGRKDLSLIEGDYWSWFFQKQNFKWVPVNADYFEHLNGGENEWIPENFVWWWGPKFNFPVGWREWSPERASVTRKRYLVMYSKAWHVRSPLPFETRADYIQRQWSYNRPTLHGRNLDQSFDAWIGMPSSDGWRPVTGPH